MVREHSKLNTLSSDSYLRIKKVPWSRIQTLRGDIEVGKKTQEEMKWELIELSKEIEENGTSHIIDEE